MIEKFSYSPGSKIYRRKTLTAFQKFLLYLIVFANIAGTAGLVFFSQQLFGESPFLWLALVSPTIITFVLISLIGFNPQGPEEDFIMPGPDEIDPNDCSTLSGKVRLANGDVRTVEVTVPNVHGVSMLSSLIDSSTNAASDQISTPEMFEMALETVQLKYPDCAWIEEPKLNATQK